MSQTKSQESWQDMLHGHQNQGAQKGQNPNDPQNKQAEQPHKQGVHDSKEGQKRRGIGTPHEKDEKQPIR